ncbi:MAG: hypothetical protein ACRD2Z_18915 [Thermoanaerobaculia bacterium]
MGVPFSPHLAARIGVFGGQVSRDFEASGIEYDGELDLGHLAALLDVHPGSSGFRFSVGAVLNQTELTGEAPLNQLLDRIDPEDIPPGVDIPDDLGRLEARFDPEEIVPYAGLGFSRRPAASGWSVTFDLGAYYQSAPDVEAELHTTLPIDAIPGLRELVDEALAEHEADLEEEAKDYRVYPVLMLGVSYRF